MVKGNATLTEDEVRALLAEGRAHAPRSPRGPVTEVEMLRAEVQRLTERVARIERALREEVR